LAYDIYYKRTDEEAQKPEEKDKNAKPKLTKVSISGPLTFWIGLLVIAAMLQLVAIPFATNYSSSIFTSYFNDFANYVIYIPGIVVLPLITALWIGDRVSSLETTKKSFVATKGLVNAVYAVMVYIVSIFIVYLIMGLIKTGVLYPLSLVTFAEYLIGIPCAIVLVMVPLFAVISSARRYG
jgi:hypothetical protein